MLAFKSLIPVRIGALLTQANLVRPEALAQALQVARQTGDLIGQVLVANYLLSEQDLQCAIELQKMIREGVITLEMGVTALRNYCQHQVPIRDTLIELGWQDKKAVKISDLARVLLDSNFINKSQLEQASWACADNSLPLGRNLILSGAITPSILQNALAVLIMVREGKIEFDTAPNLLQRCIACRLPAEEVLGISSADGNYIKTGELLASAGVITESDASNAVERGLDNGLPLGEVLLRLNAVSRLALESALKLQALVNAGEISKIQAVELLRQVSIQGIGVNAFLDEMSMLKQKVCQLLVAADVVTEKHIEAAHVEYPQYDTMRGLLLCGYVSKELFRTALRVCFLIDDGSFDRRRAIDYLNRRFVPVEDVNVFEHRDPQLQDESQSGDNREPSYQNMGGILQTA